MIQTYYSKSNQSIYDICLNTYQSLDNLIKLCRDNNVQTLAYLPKPNTPFVWDDTLVLNQAGTPYTYATAQILNAFILDRYPRAIGAWSLTSLYENYGGYAIRIRRSSDNTERDIGFMPDGSFDLATFKSFVGTDTAYVVKWYDQTGNGFHWLQTTMSLQPRFDGEQIVFITTGIAGSQSYLDQANIFGTSAPIGTYYHNFIVAQTNPPVTGTYSFGSIVNYDAENTSLTTGWGIRLGNLNTSTNLVQPWNAGGAGGKSSFYVNSVRYQVTQVAIPTSTALRVYNLLVDGFNTQGTHKFRLGLRTDSDVTNISWNGNIKEYIIYNRDMTEVQNDLTIDIMQKYGILNTGA